MRRLSACIACCALVVGCGGGERQDADEPNGTYRIDVVQARFPSRQSISAPATLAISVRNAGKQTVPDLAVSLEGIMQRSEQPGLADDLRPVFIVDRQPRDGDTAYVETWAVGPLPPGATKRLSWRLTPAVPGTHTLKYTVAAGLDGRAQAQTRRGKPPTGSFTVRVSDQPAQATVDPSTGAVER